ncbi:hypothetical protein ACS0TY_015773 [Phlomoides rotata]
MAASLQFTRDLGMAMREVDEDLAIFLGMRGGEERNEHVMIQNSDESMRGQNFQILADDNLLSLEIGNSEHDWLTPEKIDLQDSATNQTDVSKDESVSSKSEASNTCEKSSLGSCNGVNRKSSSSGDRKPAPRASTPTGRRLSLPEKSKPSRASTPSRATLTSAKPAATQVRSSTPSKATARSCTPPSRQTILARSKSASRSATPTRKPVTPSTISTAFSALKNPVVQTVKSRPSKALDAPKTSMPKRPASASRGRPAAQLSSKPRQKSCSPAKVRAPNDNNARKFGNILLSRSQGYGNGGNDNVNPVLMGTKMVERVVNMRKLAPPKRDELVSLDKTKKSSQDNSGFGRSLSKISLDMAIRHMDIGRSINIPDNLRPVSTGVSSRVSSGNSSSSGSSTVGLPESPLTSTSDSSKSSNCVDSYFLDDYEGKHSMQCSFRERT